MNRTPIVITGLGSVSVFGPRRGPIRDAGPGLQPITRWATDGIRRAHLVPQFRPGDAVSGLKTRRMDRLSVWGLVAAGLALQDAALAPGVFAADQVGVTFGTALGCLDLTEAFMRSIAENGHGKADPILFPETLGNLPASHVARHNGLRGPNITVSRGLMSGEAALLEAVGQLKFGEASVVVTLAGDVLTRGLLAWYEATGRLAAECFEVPPPLGDGRGDLVPGEGVGAVVLETTEHATKRGARVYARLLAAVLGHCARGGGAGDLEDWNQLVTRALASSPAADPLRFVVSGPGVRAMRTGAVATEGAKAPGRAGVRDVVPHTQTGTFGGGGIVGLSIALGCEESVAPGVGLALGAAGCRERAAIVVGIEAGQR